MYLDSDLILGCYLFKKKPINLPLNVISLFLFLLKHQFVYENFI